MLSLLRKDIDWLIIATLIGVITVSAVFVDYGFTVTWITHDNRLDGFLFLAWSILGIIAGLFSGLRDDLFGTRDYLRQRPISQTRLFWTKNFWSFVMMSTWLIVPLIVVTIWPMAFPENRGIAEYGRFINYAALASIMISNYAVGYFAATARGNIILRFLQGVVVGLALWMFAGLALTKNITLTPIEFVVSQVAIAAVLFFAASQSEGQNRDADMPIPQGVGLLQILIISICVFGATQTLMGSLQSSLVMDLHREYPEIARAKDGSFSMVVMGGGKRNGEANTYYIASKQHEITTEEFDVERGTAAIKGLPLIFGDPWRRQSYNDLNFRWHALYPPFGIGFNRATVMKSNGQSWFDYDTGEAIEYTFAGWKPGHSQPRVNRAIRSDGKRFGSRTQAHYTAHEHGLMILRDSTDHTVWIKSRQSVGNFSPLVLPNNDQFLALLSHRRQIKGTLGSFSSIGPHPSQPIFLGKSGKLYKLEDGDFTEIALDSLLVSHRTNVPKDQIDTQSPNAWQLTMTKFDLINRTYEAKGINPSTETRFEFSPKTSKEQLFATGILAVALTRPVLSHIFGFLSDDTDTTNQFQLSFLLRSSLFMGGKRLGFLVLCISLSLLLAWHQRRRLLRFGASAFTANIWALAIILAGPLLTILVVFIERPRAYAPVTILGEEDAPPCLLKSA